MKIGVSSYSFWRYREHTGADYCTLCTLAKEMGYEGIEFLELDKMMPVEDLAAEAQKIAAHCQSIDLPVIAYTVGADFLAEDSKAVVERLKGCVDIAGMLGAPLMRHDASRGETMADWREGIRIMAPYIREVAAYAQGKGIRTCTENHGLYMQDAYRVESLMLEVNHPNYGWLVDIGNFACVDENSIASVNVAVPYAVHVHAKDFLIRRGAPMGKGWFDSRGGTHLRGTVVGHGDIPLADCVGILKESGYDGWLSYEFEGPEDNVYALEAGVEYLKRIARGDAVSA